MRISGKKGKSSGGTNLATPLNLGPKMQLTNTCGTAVFFLFRLGPKMQLTNMCGTAVFFLFRFSFLSVLFRSIVPSHLLWYTHSAWRHPNHSIVPSHFLWYTHSAWRHPNHQQLLLYTTSVCFAWFVRADHLRNREKQYKEHLRGMPFSYGRPMLREDDALNRMFLTFLFSDQAIAITFLTDVRLLRCWVQCNIEWSYNHKLGHILQGNHVGVYRGMLIRISAGTFTTTQYWPSQVLKHTILTLLSFELSFF